MILNMVGGAGSSEPGELGTPTIDTSTGLVTTSVTKTGLLEVGTSTTLQLTTQAAKTVTPSTSAQTAVAAGKYTTGAVKVAAIPSTYGQVATGTVTAVDNNDNTEATITVSGLGFTPTNGVLFLDHTPSSVNYNITQIYNTTVRGVGNGDFGNDTCTFTKSNGKVVWKVDTSRDLWMSSGAYRYVIWG